MLMLLALALGPNDAELVRRFKAGDRHAFSEIVRRYQDRVFSTCLRLIGTTAVAEEVAQDVFLALFRSLGGFRGDAQLSTWVYRVTINHCKNRRQYGRRRREGQHDPLDPQPGEEGHGRQLASDQPDADAGLHRSEAEHLIQEALEGLDEEARRIIVLRDMEDLDYEEIAEILELPRGTVKSRLHRARAALAARLAGRIKPEDVL